MSNHSFPTEEAERKELSFNYHTTHVFIPFEMDLYMFKEEDDSISGTITKGRLLISGLKTAIIHFSSGSLKGAYMRHN